MDSFRRQLNRNYNPYYLQVPQIMQNHNDIEIEQSPRRTERRRSSASIIEIHELYTALQELVPNSPSTHSGKGTSSSATGSPRYGPTEILKGSQPTGTDVPQKAMKDASDALHGTQEISVSVPCSEIGEDSSKNLALVDQSHAQSQGKDNSEGCLKCLSSIEKQTLWRRNRSLSLDDGQPRSRKTSIFKQDSIDMLRNKRFGRTSNENCEMFFDIVKDFEEQQCYKNVQDSPNYSTRLQKEINLKKRRSNSLSVVFETTSREIFEINSFNSRVSVPNHLTNTFSKALSEHVHEKECKLSISQLDAISQKEQPECKQCWNLLQPQSNFNEKEKKKRNEPRDEMNRNKQGPNLSDNKLFSEVENLQIIYGHQAKLENYKETVSLVKVANSTLVSENCQQQSKYQPKQKGQRKESLEELEAYFKAKLEDISKVKKCSSTAETSNFYRGDSVEISSSKSRSTSPKFSKKHSFDDLLASRNNPQRKKGRPRSRSAYDVHLPPAKQINNEVTDSSLYAAKSSTSTSRSLSLDSQSDHILVKEDKHTFADQVNKRLQDWLERATSISLQDCKPDMEQVKKNDVTPKLLVDGNELNLDDDVKRGKKSRFAMRKVLRKKIARSQSISNLKEVEKEKSSKSPVRRRLERHKTERSKSMHNIFGEFQSQPKQKVNMLRYSQNLLKIGYQRIRRSKSRCSPIDFKKTSVDSNAGLSRDSCDDDDFSSEHGSSSSLNASWRSGYENDDIEVSSINTSPVLSGRISLEEDEKDYNYKTFPLQRTPERLTPELDKKSNNNNTNLFNPKIPGRLFPEVNKEGNYNKKRLDLIIPGKPENCCKRAAPRFPTNLPLFYSPGNDVSPLKTTKKDSCHPTIKHEIGLCEPDTTRDAFKGQTSSIQCNTEQTSDSPHTNQGLPSSQELQGNNGLRGRTTSTGSEDSGCPAFEVVKTLLLPHEELLTL